MSDEPLFCPLCGAEDYSCGHDPRESGETRYCEFCGAPSTAAVCKECKEGVGVYVCGPSNTKCSCQCPEGPCAHDFTEERDVVDDRGRVVGRTLVCKRCGLDAIAHSLWTGP